jgi:predicted porin
MQKKIIALAVAGLVSGAAFAQTNVTVYGRADLGYVYSKSDYKKFQGIENGQSIGGGSSRIGLMGEEALGNGLKAIFKFEWGVTADVGSGPTGARYTYVGLAGNFGNVLLGRNGTAADYYFGATGVHGINGLEPMNLFRGKMPLVNGGDRWDNSITYNSPNFSGFDFMAIYSFGERVNSSDPGDPAHGGNGLKGADTSDGKLGLGIKYANGPLYLTALYHVQTNDDSQRAWNGNDHTGFGAKGWAIGGTYDFKVVKLYANYFRVKANNGGLAAAAEAAIYNATGLSVDGGSDKQTTWSLGIGVPVSSAGTVLAEYAQYKDSLGGGINTPIGVFGATRDAAGYLGGSPGTKAKGYSVGYRHNLSKRTSLYTYLSYFDNDRGIGVGWGKTNAAGEKQTNFSAGILHVF